MRRSQHFGACGQCVFWEARDDSARLAGEGYQAEGLCRRHPPVAIPSSKVQADGSDADGDVGCLARWPRTFAESDWCGEFSALAEVAGRHRDEQSGEATQ